METGLNEDGFITTWLLLAPIPLDEGQSGADTLDKQQIPEEAKLQPKEGEKVKIGGKALVGQKYQAKESFLDFNAFLGKQTEDSVGYAVCYLYASSEMKDIKLKTGSDDQAKVYLNGKAVFKHTEGRPLETDEDTTEVTLRKDINLLVFELVNEKEDWSGCARFMDKDGKVIKNLKATIVPPEKADK